MDQLWETKWKKNSFPKAKLVELAIFLLAYCKVEP